MKLFFIARYCLFDYLISSVYFVKIAVWTTRYTVRWGSQVYTSCASGRGLTRSFNTSTVLSQVMNVGIDKPPLFRAKREQEGEQKRGYSTKEDRIWPVHPATNVHTNQPGQQFSPSSARNHETPPSSLLHGADPGLSACRIRSHGVDRNPAPYGRASILVADILHHEIP